MTKTNWTFLLVRVCTLSMTENIILSFNVHQHIQMTQYVTLNIEVLGTIGYFIMDSLENQLSWGVIQIYSFPQWNLSYIQLYLIYCWPFGMRPLFIIYINAFENNRSMHCTFFCQKTNFRWEWIMKQLQINLNVSARWLLWFP